MLRSTLIVCLLAGACSDADSGITPPDADATDATDATDADVADTIAPETTTVADTATSPDTAPPTDTQPDAPAEPVLEIVVTVPPETPPESTIHLSGNQPELGDWDGQGVTLARGDDGRWRVALSFPIGTALEFKITRGSWETVEKDAAGNEIENRAHVVQSARESLDITVASWRDIPPGQTGDGSSRIEFIHGVSSAFLEPTRDVIVYLPPGYDSAPASRFPVLYMHDGQNLMDPATSAFGVAWEVDDTATALVDEGKVEPVIIVGIYNTADRFGEYTPVPDPEYGGGNADNYGRFIVEELKPDIDATYRTRPDAAATGVAGSSLGGLVSMYLGLVRSDTFGKIGVVSPSVWWADRDIVDRVEALDRKLPLQIWLDIGTAEGSGGGAVDGARALRDALVAEGWVLGGDLIYQEYPGAAHDEAAWAARVDDILQALYPAP